MNLTIDTNQLGIGIFDYLSRSISIFVRFFEFFKVIVGLVDDMRKPDGGEKINALFQPNTIKFVPF